MLTTTLACGPYFDEGGAIGSLILFLLVKPLAYFAFIQAFRYRVNRPIPMRFSQAFNLTAARVGLSILIIGCGVAFMAALGPRLAGTGTSGESLLIASWIYLYIERLFSWWLIGSKAAGLRGRRLVGWIISGTLIGTAFDIAMLWGLIEGAVPQVAIVAVIGCFIVALHIIGRRDSLRLRFTNSKTCVQCQYDLTGNLSGHCPECGLVFDSCARLT